MWANHFSLLKWFCKVELLFKIPYKTLFVSILDLWYNREVEKLKCKHGGIYTWQQLGKKEGNEGLLKVTVPAEKVNKALGSSI